MNNSIHIGVFVDGTGNHKDNDEIIGNGTQSNVAKLSKVFEQTLGNEDYHIYISGVGTKSLEELGFENKDGNFKDEKGDFYDERLHDIKEGKGSLTDYYDTTAMGTGLGILGKGVGDQVDEAFDKIRDTVKDIHQINPNSEINLDIVGFSRGAASSRALVNKLHKEGITGENVHINFVGAFDTVSSIGLANGDNGDYNLNLNVQSANHIVQFVASDEKRANFRSEAMPQFDIKMDGAHADVGGAFGILDNKEYYAQFKNYTVDNDKIDAFVDTQREEAKVSGYEGISYTVTSLDRHNQSSVYVGYVQSKDIAYGLSNVSLHKMYDEMKESDIPMTELKVLGNIENNPEYSLWEIPTALKEHPENVSDYIHNSSIDRSRVYPVGEDFVRAPDTDRIAHHAEKSGERSMDMNEPSKAEHEHTIADEINKSYEYGEDSHTTMRPEDMGKHVVNTFTMDESKVLEINRELFDNTSKVHEVLEKSNLTDFNQSNANDHGMEIGD